VTDAQYREGVVNINTAPVEALAAIPGVDETIYNAILEARQSGMTFTGLNDIFQLTALNRQQLQALVDHVCTKSSVYLVRVKVRVGSSPKIYAAQALVELPASQSGTETTSEETLPNATILQWREVQRMPGWSSWIPPSSYNAP
jgi:type II secretory pathway component PulK